MSHVSQNFVCTSAPGTTPAPRLLPEGWEEEEGWCKDSRDGERERCSVAGGFRLQRRYRNTLSGQTQTEYPAFGLTAAKAVQLRMGGSPPKGGRGRAGKGDKFPCFFFNNNHRGNGAACKYSKADCRNEHRVVSDAEFAKMNPPARSASPAGKGKGKGKDKGDSSKGGGKRSRSTPPEQRGPKPDHAGVCREHLKKKGSCTETACKWTHPDGDEYVKARNSKEKANVEWAKKKAAKEKENA